MAPPPLLLLLLSILQSLLPRLPSQLAAPVHALLLFLFLATTPPPLPTTRVHLPLASLVPAHALCTTPHAPPTRTILVLHGLSATAENDPRVLHLARALAHAAPTALVLVPHLSALAIPDLAARPAALVARVVAAVAADRNLCPSRRVSLVAACITGGLALLAAAHPRLSPRVRAILTVGAHADARAVLAHVARSHGGRGDAGGASYAAHAVLASFLPRGAALPALPTLLAAAVADDHRENVGCTQRDLPRLRARFPAEARRLDRLRADGECMARELRRVAADNEEAMEAMSPVGRLRAVQCEHVVLVHARQDEIVPVGEVEKLRAGLQDSGKEVRVCVTGLLDHGDRKPVGLRDVGEVFKLIWAFAAFFGGGGGGAKRNLAEVPPRQALVTRGRHWLRLWHKDKER